MAFRCIRQSMSAVADNGVRVDFDGKEALRIFDGDRVYLFGVENQGADRAPAIYSRCYENESHELAVLTEEEYWRLLGCAIEGMKAIVGRTKKDVSVF